MVYLAAVGQLGYFGVCVKDGVEYVIVNDPAGATNEEVRRLYRADQFFKAWVNKVAYLVIPPAQ